MVGRERPQQAIDIDHLLALGGAAVEAGHRSEDEHALAAQHGADWLAFWSWCETNGFSGETLPVSLEALAGWLSWAVEALDDARLTATLQAIRLRHAEAGHLVALKRLGA